MFSSLLNKNEDQIEELEDEYLIELAKKRLKKYDPSNLLSQEKVYEMLDIKEEDLENFDQIEIE